MAKGKIDPSALSLADLVAILQKAGSKLASEELIRQHIAAGAPTNSDGTVHLIHFTAWLAKRVR